MAEITVLEELNKFYQIDPLDLTSINTEISPKDDMYRGDDYHYFSVGFSALKNILLSLAGANMDRHSVNSILDFPSGYGRVLRFIRAYFPSANITGAELNTDAVNFLQRQFDVTTLNSQKDFSKITIDHTFDLIWCGSLLTHLSMNKTLELLDFFYRALNVNGILIFTSQGRYSSKLLDDDEKAMQWYDMDDRQRRVILEQYERNGYGYADYRGVSDYGISVISLSWFIRLFESDDKFTIIMCNEKAWDNHHDVIAVVKTAFLPSIGLNSQEAWKKVEESDEKLSGICKDIEAARERELEKDQYIAALLNSRSYRLGRALTWPVRKILGRK